MLKKTNLVQLLSTLFLVLVASARGDARSWKDPKRSGGGYRAESRSHGVEL